MVLDKISRFESVASIVSIALVSVFVCSAQQTISQEKWQRYHQIAQEVCRSVPYRTKITIENKMSSDETWHPYSESQMEFMAAPYRSHFVGKYLETIQIGSIVYTKQSDGSWLKKDLKKEPATKGTVQLVERISNTFTQLEKKYTFMQIAGENSHVLFQADSRYKMKYLSDGIVFEHHDVDRVWFDDLGRYVKTEKITYEPRRQVFIRRLETYEYDSNIKIEAPSLEQ